MQLPAPTTTSSIAAGKPKRHKREGDLKAPVFIQEGRGSNDHAPITEITTSSVAAAKKEAVSSTPQLSPSGIPAAETAKGAQIPPTEQGTKPLASEQSPPSQTTPQDPPIVAATPPTVLIILADPSVAELSDLNNKSVVVADLSSISQPDVGAALRAAGADAVQLTQGSRGDAIDQLTRGLVSAAIVAFVTSDEATAIIESVKTEEAAAATKISGFKILRVSVADRPAS